MSCSCGGSTTPSSFSYNFSGSNCTTCSSTGCNTDAAAIIYSGPDLACINLPTGSNLQAILEAMDAKICQATMGDWGTYNYYCLDDVTPITTQQQFVETISSYVCDLSTTFNSFVNNTYTPAIAAINSSIYGLTNPNLTSCVLYGTTSILNTDNITIVFTKIITALCNTITAINPSGAAWTSSCLSITPAPTTITAAMNIIITKLCSLQTQIDGLATPITINNSGNCLATVGGGATDTIVQTIGYLTDYVCTLVPTFDTGALTFGCVTSASNLQDTVQHIITKLSTISQDYIAEADPTYFTTDWVDSGNHCLGKSITIDPTSPLLVDKYVAATATDATPGTLQDKMVAGTNISLDFSTPTQVTINATGIADTYKVKTTSTDVTPGYLVDKTIGSSTSGFTIGISEDVTSLTDHKMRVGITPDYYTIALNILSTIQSNSVLYTIFCDMVTGCSSSCKTATSLTITGITPTP